MKTFKVLAVMLFLSIALAPSVYSDGVFDKVGRVASIKKGVKEISYEQFLIIRNAGNYILLDVLSPESYKNGHIEGAQSFPVNTINKETASTKIPEGSNVIVYCGGFLCHASTNAAKKLSDLGYNVIDYKGGLEEWKEKGNKFAN